VSGLFLVNLAFCHDDPNNPRGDLGDVSSLAQSLAQDGQQQPLQLIPLGGGHYQIHEGHRRKAALLRLGEQAGKAIERRFHNDVDRVISQGVIHLHSEPWSPMAWARWLHRLSFEMPAGQNLDRHQLAHRTGRSPAWVRDTLALFHLTPAEQDALEAGKLTRAEALLRLAGRRAARDGAAAPRTKTKTALAGTYFSKNHQLATQVAVRCASNGLDHVGRPKIGGVGCGECWENTIRDDALTTVPRPVLAAA
jgi:ParB family chromosome partitioning protein